MSDSFWPQGLQHPRLSLSFTSSWSLLKLMSIELVMPFNHLILCLPLLFLPSIFPSIRVFSSESALRISGQSTGASSASASVLPMMNIQDWFPLGLTVWFPCKNTQESTPAPQLKSINSLVLSLIYGPTLTPIHGYWKKKKHSFDYTDLCQQSNVSAF